MPCTTSNGMKYELDATNQSLGRLASKIAFILRGKNLVSYTPNELPDNEVTVENIKSAKFTGSKLSKKIYQNYSGYHGGVKTRKLSELWESRPEYVLRGMVYNMLPLNKMRDKIIKNLLFSNEGRSASGRKSK